MLRYSSHFLMWLKFDKSTYPGRGIVKVIMIQSYNGQYPITKNIYK